MGELQCRFEVEFEEYGYDGLDLIAGQPGLQKRSLLWLLSQCSFLWDNWDVLRRFAPDVHSDMRVQELTRG